MAQDSTSLPTDTTSARSSAEDRIRARDQLERIRVELEKVNTKLAELIDQPQVRALYACASSPPRHLTRLFCAWSAVGRVQASS